MKPFIIAFSMYSKIPMPKTDWEEKSMRYALCYFPLVGAVIGACMLAVFYAFSYLHPGLLLQSAVLAVLPLLITGGIHLDGFLDTMDAKSSYQEKERRLAILSDSHVGAFAVISCVVYYLLTLGLFGEVEKQGMYLLAVGYVYERALSALSLVTLKGAKKTGMLAAFAETAEKKQVRIVLAGYVLASVCILVWIAPVRGAFLAAAGLFVFWHYRHMAYRDFGGITGDLAGYFVQLCELAFLTVVALPL